MTVAMAGPDVGTGGPERRRPEPRIASLDGLRAVSILIVIAVHMTMRFHPVGPILPYANFGVQIFFVISGYIITTLLLKERERLGSIDLGAFYLRRILRIVPVAYAFFAVVLTVYWARFRALDVVSLLTFTTNYDLGRPTLVAHIWSLSVEEQFYILWPVTLALFFQRRVRILVFALCLSPVLTIAFHFLHLNAYRGIAFPTTYDSLALGCLTAVLQPRLAFLRSRWFLTAAPVALLLQAVPWTGHVSGLIHVVFLWPFTHLAIAVFVMHAIWRRYWILNVKPVIWIGTISYSLYLWQGLFVVEPVLAERWILLAILACGATSYYLVERPFQALRRRLHPDRIANRDRELLEEKSAATGG